MSNALVSIPEFLRNLAEYIENDNEITADVDVFLSSNRKTIMEDGEIVDKITVNVHRPIPEMLKVFANNE